MTLKQLEAFYWSRRLISLPAGADNNWLLEQWLARRTSTAPF